MVTPHTPPHRTAELYFVEGVLYYCKAEATSAGYIQAPLFLKLINEYIVSDKTVKREAAARLPHGAHLPNRLLLSSSLLLWSLELSDTKVFEPLIRALLGSALHFIAGTLHTEPYTPTPTPYTLNAKPSTLNLQPRTPPSRHTTP